MNILFLYRIYPNYGGVEVVTTVLANKFMEDGNNVFIASFEQPHPELLDQLNPKAKVLNLDYPVNSSNNQRTLSDFIKNNSIDILINQWGLPFKTTLLCNKAIKGTKCKLVSVLHGSPNTSKIILKAQDKCKNAKNFITKSIYSLILKAKEFVIKRSIKYNVKHCSKYVLLSNSFIKPLIQYAGLKSAENLCAIGNPITIPVDYKDFDITKKESQLLYVGRMDFENKRVNRIVEIWEKMYQKHMDWELVLVGDGPHKQELQNYVETKDIKRVRFEGFQKDPPIEYYKKAKIFLLTSDLEGFGLVIIESMSYGVVPIVYGSYEAIYDIIEEAKCGYITPKPFNASYTIEKIEELIGNPDNLQKMAENAMERSKLFSIENVSKQWYNLFFEVRDKS